MNGLSFILSLQHGLKLVSDGAAPLMVLCMQMLHADMYHLPMQLLPLATADTPAIHEGLRTRLNGTEVQKPNTSCPKQLRWYFSTVRAILRDLAFALG